MTAITRTRIDMQDKAKNIDLALFVNMLFFSTSFYPQARQQSFLIMDFENTTFQPRLKKSLPCMSSRLAGSRLDVALMGTYILLFLLKIVNPF